MKFRTLGKSPLQVSELCLGTMMFGDQTPVDEARRITAHAHANGVNFIDTADVYTLGASETMVGELIREHRHDWVLATKLGNRMGGDKPNTSHYSRAWVLHACHASLQRLGTDHIDIYYLHRDYNGMNLEEPLRAIDQLLRDGKVRYWGISNFRGWRITEMVHLARQLGMPGPVVCQPYYNLLNRMPEVEILEACMHHVIGVVPYSPIARGVLSGKYKPASAPPEGSRGARADTRMMQTEFREESFVVAQELRAWCEQHKPGTSLAHFATAWVLANRAISSVIAGPRTFDQWTDYFGALDCAITAADEARVDSLVKPGHPSTPGYTDPVYPLAGRVVSPR